MATRKLQDLIKTNNGGDLADLASRAQALATLAGALARAVPGELAGDIVAANVRDGGELVILCRTPARAARLRYEAPALLAAAAAAGESVDRLTVRVSRDAMTAGQAGG